MGPRRDEEAPREQQTMSPLIQRARGVVLRLARHRARSIVIGLVLAVPAVWVELTGTYAAWWVEGLSLMAGATGLALIWIGLTGVGPDWIDDET
jgi:hypothetical protein